MTTQLDRHEDALRAAVRELDEARPEDRPTALWQIDWFARRSPFATVREAAQRAMAEATP